MLSISALGAAGAAKSRYCQDTASDEAQDEGYYQNDRDPPGKWDGDANMLAALGLQPGQKITDRAYDVVIRGFHPETGEALVQKAGDEHRAGWDLTFSAPKSVSALWAVAGDADRAAIQAAHDRAVGAALEHLQERAAVARRGKGGAETEKLPGLIVARYQHSTSRELDPDLHTHSLVANLAQRSDGTWGGIESRNLYDWKMASGAVYRAQLSEEMQKLGFQTEADRDYFRMIGVSDNLCQEWSKRREQIKDALGEAGIEEGHGRASEIAALGSRKTKTHTDRDELFQRWKDEAAEHGLDADKIASRDLQDVRRDEAQDQVEQAEDDEPSIYDRLTRNDSTFSEADLWQRAAIEQQHEGRGLDAVRGRVAELLGSGEIVKLRGSEGETRYSTRSMIRIEKSMAQAAEARKSDASHVLAPAAVDSAIDDFAVARGFSLSAEQQGAVRHITQNPGAVQLVRGAAGSGKSTMAQAARMAWQSQGFTVRGVALAGKAAAGLEEGSGIKSQTLHSLLNNLDKGSLSLSQRDILIVDEAGMIGSRQMQRLLEHADQAGAKVVLIGDERQLQAIDAGGAFRALQRLLGFSKLTEVRRHEQESDRDAANALAQGNAADALDIYLEHDRINIADDKSAAMNDLARDWRQAWDPARPGEALMLAGKRADVADLNNRARALLAAEHRLTNETEVSTKSGKLNFGEGDRLLFTKNNRQLDVKNGQLGTIQKITIGKDQGREFLVLLDGGETRKFSVDGEYTDIAHGYAVTVHKSQGVTVDHTFGLASSMNDREFSYVQFSRHRKSAHMYLPIGALDEAEDREGIDWEDKKDVSTRLKTLSKKMSRSRAKDTTLDYSSAPPESAEGDWEAAAAKNEIGLVARMDAAQILLEASGKSDPAIMAKAREAAQTTIRSGDQAADHARHAPRPTQATPGEGKAAAQQQAQQAKGQAQSQAKAQQGQAKGRVRVRER